MIALLRDSKSECLADFVPPQLLRGETLDNAVVMPKREFSIFAAWRRIRRPGHVEVAESARDDGQRRRHGLLSERLHEFFEFRNTAFKRLVSLRLDISIN